MFRIIADSCCDLSVSAAAEMGIDTLLPMKISFGDIDYYDGVTITPEEFYARLKEDKAPARTALISVGDFEKAFYEFRHEDILVITLSSELSGTFRSAEIAKNLSARENITLIDSRAGSGAEAILLEVACALRKAGATVAEAAKKIAELIPRLRIYAAVDTLKYMIRGGRLSKTAGAVAGMLNIKPVVALREGKLISYKKYRGMNAALRGLKDIAFDEDGVDTDYPVYICHATAPDYAAILKSHFPSQNMTETPVRECLVRECLMGTTIGAHAGPGTVEIAFVAAQRV